MINGLADAGDRLAIARLLGCDGTDSAEVRRGPGWTAVRTGVASNDWNGVVCVDPDLVQAHEIDEAVSWFAEIGVPACWLNLRADPRLGALLTERGLRPERTGWWAGRELVETTADQLAPVGIEIRPVRDRPDLDQWLDVAEQCGWLNGAADRRARRELYAALLWDCEGWSYWIALLGDRAVAMASSFRHESTLELSALAVLDDHQRRGIGRALTAAVLREGAGRGARLAVAAPSPEGWELYRRLGFTSARVTPDVCWYLPHA